MKLKAVLSYLMCVVLVVLCCSFDVSAADDVALTDGQQAFYDAVVRDDGSVTFDEIVDVLNTDHVLGLAILDYYDSVVVDLDAGLSDVEAFSETFYDESSEWGGSIVYDTETGEEFYDDDSELIELVDSGVFASDAEPYYTEITRPNSSARTKCIYKLYVCPAGSTTPDGVGTGFALSNEYLATAAHVLYREESGWVGRIICVPCPYWVKLDSGTDVDNLGTANAPYGYVYQVGKNMVVGADWKTTFSSYSDWGVLQLQTPKSVGSVTLRQVGSSIVGSAVSVYGYPSATAYPNNMLRYDGNVVRVFDRRVYYFSDAVVHGCSGGPVYDSLGRVIGIAVYSEPMSTGYTRFCSFDKYLYAKLRTYQ